MTLGFFLPHSGTQPCWWEKGDPQLTANAEEGRGRSSALSRFLGWERKLPSPLLVISLADRRQRGQETEKPGFSSPLPAVPHVKGCWWGELLSLLLPTSPQIKHGACREQPGQAGQASQGSALPWVVLYGTGIHPFLPLLSNSEDQTTQSSTFENINNTYILVKDAI